MALETYSAGRIPGANLPGGGYNSRVKQFWSPPANCVYELRKVVLKKRVNGMYQFYDLGFQAVILMESTDSYPDNTVAIDFRPEIEYKKATMKKVNIDLEVVMDDCSRGVIAPLAKPMVVCVPRAHRDLITYLPAGLINLKNILTRVPQGKEEFKNILVSKFWSS